VLLWLAFGPGPLRPTTGPDQIAAGGVDGLGGLIVLTGLPDDRVAVVLAAVVDGHPHSEGEGSLPLLDVAVARRGRVGRAAGMGEADLAAGG